MTQPLHATTLVVAGPGSGKTRVLTCRIAYLLLQTAQLDPPPQPPELGGGWTFHRRDRILAVTFTRKAANEMKQRLYKLLPPDHSEEQPQENPAQWTEEPVQLNDDEEEQQFHGYYPDDDYELEDTYEDDWHQVQQSMDEAATQNQAPPEAATASSGNGLYEDDAAIAFYDQALQQDEAHHSSATTAPTHSQEPLQLRRPLGTSSFSASLSSSSFTTTTTTTRQPFNPRQELWRVTFGTFHSICAKILRWNIHELVQAPSVLKHTPEGQIPGLDTNFAIVDTSDQERIIKQLLKEKCQIPPNNLTVPIKSIQNGISWAKEAFAQGENPFDPKTLNLSVERNRIVKAIYHAYRATLFANNQLDFDDLIYLARELLLEYDTVRHRMQQRWQHVLVDEFQDTSLTQLDIVQQLTNRSLLVVGDADQSIYGWRGAHATLLQEFPRHFAGTRTLYLMENYRSTSNIVKAAQKVISLDETNQNKNNKNHQQQHPRTLRQNMIPQREAGRMPRVLALENGKDEGTYKVSLEGNSLPVCV